MPYNYFLKIVDNPKRLRPVVPDKTPELSVSRKALQLMNNYQKTDSAGVFTLPEKAKTNYAKNKSKFALWYVSNCYSTESLERIKIYKELRKYISIDVYGNDSRCKELKPKVDPCDNDLRCSKQLMSTYKFYLSFENSQCNYYITGK